MNKHISTAELKSFALTGLPESVQGIEYRAKKGQWPFEYVDGVGRGGKLKMYLLEGLPIELANEIKQKQANQIIATADARIEKNPVLAAKKTTVAKRALNQLALPIDEHVQGLNQSQMDCAHARMALVAEVRHLHATLNMPIKGVVQYFINQLDAGLLTDNLENCVAIANARSGGKAKLSFSALYTWVREFNKAKTPAERLAILAPIKPKEEVPLLSIDWLPDWLTCWGNPNKPSVNHIYNDFKAQFGDKYGADFPSIHQVRYMHSKLPEVVRQRGRMTGSAYRAIMPYIKRDWLRFNPNDIWVGDGHGFKAKVAHPIHGQPFQPEITAIIDAATRFIVGWSVSLSESTIAHADALRHAMTTNEPPLMYYTDNGSGPTGKMVDADITGILPRLGIDHPTGIPGNAQGRGIIERLWQTVTIPLARGYETFVGASADDTTKTLNIRNLNSAMNAERQGKELNPKQTRYRKKMPTWNQFLADLTAAIDAYNHEHEHRELLTATNGQCGTPAAYRTLRMAETGQVSEPLSQMELDLMFRPEEIRTVSRGLVSLFNNSYFSMALAEFHDEQVRIGYDLHNADEVIVKKMDGSFICKATFNGNVRAGFAEPRVEQKRQERVNNIVKRQEEKIALAKAELNPAIEQQPDFNSLVMKRSNDVIDADYELLATGTDGSPTAKEYKLYDDW